MDATQTRRHHGRANEKKSHAVSQPPETEEVRRKLAGAWRAVGNRLVAEGYNPADVTETMLTVAIASWSGLREPKEAAGQLRAIAERLEQTGSAEPGAGEVAAERLRRIGSTRA
jgi:hypothetical protein